MTDAQILRTLRALVDDFGDALRMARECGGLPVVKVIIRPREPGKAIALVVGVEPVRDEDEDE